MNKDVVRKWIKALRSGDYNQARYCLRSFDNDYCVIGVLCDLHRKEHGQISDWKPQYDYYIYKEFAIVPDVIKEWLGVNWVHLHLDRLVHLNDDMRKSFAQLATYIEDKMKEFDPSFVA